MPESFEPSTKAASTIGPSHFIDAIARHAEGLPDKVAVAEIGDGGEVVCECTFASLAARAAALADKLSEVTDIGDAVIAILPSGIDYAAWFCAAIAAGVRLIPMHTQVTGIEAIAVARISGAKLAIMAPGVSAAAALAELRLPNLATEPTPQGRRRLGVIRSRSGAVVLGSSGTMGLPKLALRESRALDADAANVIRGMTLTNNDCVLVSTPLSHSYGVDVLLATLTAGASLHVVAQFDAGVLAEHMLRQATVLPGVPFMFEALARVSPAGPTRIRLVLSAGSSLPERVRQEFARAWNLEIGQLYGATELGTVSMESPESADFDPTSVGKPLPGVSMRIVDCDDAMRRLGVGIEGQLAVSAPSMLSGYLDGDVPLVDGHLLTGDLARIGKDGRVYITGRQKLLIDVGAYKVNPLEVEAELVKHPEIADCVVVGLAFSDTIQRLRAVCVPKDLGRAPSPEELRKYLRERLSPTKVPRVIEFAARLPRGPTGKVLRDGL